MVKLFVRLHVDIINWYGGREAVNQTTREVMKQKKREIYKQQDRLTLPTPAADHA
jgi:hypothetical protein